MRPLQTLLPPPKSRPALPLPQGRPALQPPQGRPAHSAGEPIFQCAVLADSLAQAVPVGVQIATVYHNSTVSLFATRNRKPIVHPETRTAGSKLREIHAAVMFELEPALHLSFRAPDPLHGCLVDQMLRDRRPGLCTPLVMRADVHPRCQAPKVALFCSATRSVDRGAHGRSAWVILVSGRPSPEDAPPQRKRRSNTANPTHRGSGTATTPA